MSYCVSDIRDSIDNYKAYIEGKMGDDLMDFFNVRKEFKKVYLKVCTLTSYLSFLRLFVTGPSNHGESQAK